MGLTTLVLCDEGDFGKRDLNYRLTSTVYNLCFWIGGSESYVYVPGRSIALALVDCQGRFKVYSESCNDVGKLRLRLRFTLGVDEDISEFYGYARGDILVGNFVESYPGWRLRSTDLWWALVTAICQQNASFKQGWRILHNIVKAYNKRVVVNGTPVPRPPTPSEVLGDPEKLLIAGAGYRARTILAVAKALVDGLLNLEYVERASAVEAEKELLSIKGIGHYTARLSIALSTRKYELPPVDRWLRRVVSVAYGVDDKFVEEFWRRKWGKWSALAAILTTISLDAEPLRKALERVRRRDLLPKARVYPSPVNMEAFCEFTQFL